MNIQLELWEMELIWKALNKYRSELPADDAGSLEDIKELTRDFSYYMDKANEKH